MHRGSIATALVVMCLASPAGAGEAALRTITVTGKGEAVYEPDLARVSFAVVALSDTLPAAVEDNNRRAGRLYQSLREAGVADRDVQTAGYRARRREPNRVERAAGVWARHQVEHEVRVTVRDLGQLGAVIAEALVHADEARRLEFGSSRPASIAAEARRGAMRDARRRALDYAAAEELGLGRVLSVAEGAVRLTPRPVTFERRASASAPLGAEAGEVPVAPGSLTAAETVRVVYEIGEMQRKPFAIPGLIRDLPWPPHEPQR